MTFFWTEGVYILGGTCMLNYLSDNGQHQTHWTHTHIVRDPLHFFFIPGCPCPPDTYTIDSYSRSEVSIFQPAAVRCCKSECRIPVAVCDNGQQDQDSSQPWPARQISAESVQRVSLQRPILCKTLSVEPTLRLQLTQYRCYRTCYSICRKYV
jgi:hypothetical protein